jgi:hypothetical protein
MFCHQLALASKQGVYTAHVIYKFLQNIGDFWRRNIRDDQRRGVYTGEPAAYRKRSTEHLPDRVRNRLRKLTWLEREMAYALGGNTLMLYQPLSTRLDEKLRRFWVRKRTRQDMGHLIDLETWRDPYRSEEYTAFTLTPMMRVSGDKIARRIDHYMGDSSFSRMLGDTKVLAADFMQLPALEKGNPYARHMLAELREACRRGDEDGIGTIGDSLCQVLEKEGEFPEAEEAYEELMEAYGLVEGKKVRVMPTDDGMVWTATEVPVQSDSDETVTYAVRGTTNDEDEASVSWRCECKGNKRWLHCKHVDRVKEALAELEGS